MVMLFISMTIQNTFAQDSPLALKIGDRVPEMTFEIMNDNKGRISLSSLRGKLVILDFWSGSCTACIQKFPYLDSLQTMFGDQIKIILVDPKQFGDDEEKVNRIFDIYRKNYGKPLQLSSTIYDTTAVKYFPHKVQSHFVWIDKEGIVKSISGYVKKEDIVLMLAGNNPNITQKNDFVVSQKNEALFTVDISNIKFKSMLTGYLEGLEDFRKQKNKPFGSLDLKEGVRFINMPVLNILANAYSLFPKYNRIIIEGVDRSSFIRPDSVAYEKWILNNTYCYELIAPGMDTEYLKQQTKLDIEKAFHLKITIENRMVLCWVIKMDEHQMKQLQRKIISSAEALMSLKKISGQFQDLAIPVITETRFDTKLFSYRYEHYNVKRPDEADLRKFVKENGLTLVKEEREIEVFVIKKVK
jgi:thiol-disulfide isomerase/thioredoxin